jgi:hypothetical protein
MEGKQQTFALLDEWVPAPAEGTLGGPATRESALAELARRYFRGHGPATVADLSRWAGIPKRDATAALGAVAEELESAVHEGDKYWFAPETAHAIGRAKPRATVHLLPGFDEYMLGYVGRSHQLGAHLEQYGSRVGSNGMLAPTVLVGGRAVGVWRRTLNARTVAFELTEFEPLSAAQRTNLAAEQRRYARFLGRTVAGHSA